MNFLYHLLYTTTLGAAAGCALFSSHIREGFKGRWGLRKRLGDAFSGKASPVWFHVASSGEFEQALPILDAFKARRPDVPLFLSYFSPSAKKAVALEKKRRGDASLPWDFADYSPWDSHSYLATYLKILKPRAYVSLYREIWPNLLTALTRHKVPRLLFATHFPENNWKLRWFYTQSLKSFDFIGTVDDTTTAQLTLLLDSQFVHTVGDSRVARVVQRKEKAPAAPWRSFFESQKVFVGGSLWPEDFTAAKPLLRELLSKGWRLILVPHQTEGSFTQGLLTWLQSQKIPARLWSHWRFEPDDRSHLVVNEIGPLAELYQVASMALVGGSFKSKVHNVLEPAVYGFPILTGPHTHNADEVRILEQIGVLSRALDAQDLVRKANEQLTLGVDRKESVRNYFNEAAQVPETYAAILEKFL